MNVVQFVLEWLFMIRDRWEFGDWETRTLALANGGRILIDSTDYATVNTYTWRVNFRTGRSRRGRQVYRYTERAGKPKGILLTTFLHDVPDGMVTRFQNGDRFDFRRKNLAFCDRSHLNASSQRRAGTSGFRGVQKHRNKWTAKIRVRGEQRYLGIFDDAILAAQAYNAAALKYFGECARLNPV